MTRPDDYYDDINSFLRKYQIEHQLLCQVTSKRRIKLINQMCNNTEIVDFIMSFSGRRIALAMHKEGLLDVGLGIMD